MWCQEITGISCVFGSAVFADYRIGRNGNFGLGFMVMMKNGAFPFEIFAVFFFVCTGGMFFITISVVGSSAFRTDNDIVAFGKILSAPRTWIS